MSSGRIPSVEGGIQPTIVDAKGDLIVATAADTVSRLAVGTNDYVLTADSSTSTGLKWAASSAGGLTKITSATFSAVSSVSFPNGTFSSTYKDYLVFILLTNASTDLIVRGRLRASGSDDTNSNYFSFVDLRFSNGTASNIANASQDIFTLGYTAGSVSGFSGAYSFISPQAAEKTTIQGEGLTTNSGYDLYAGRTAVHQFNATTQFDSFTFIASTGNFTGRYAVYGLEA